MCFKTNVTKTRKSPPRPMAATNSEAGAAKQYRYKVRGTRPPGLLNKPKRIVH